MVKKSYIDRKDVNGKPLYIGCKVMSPTIATVAGIEEMYDELVLMRDDCGLYYKGTNESGKLHVDFLGSNEVILVEE
jgi:hypothetical protein